MKYLIGFALGVMAASAVATAQELIVHNDLLHKLQESATADVSAVVMTARDPEGRASILKVDAEGRVLCNPAR